MKIWADRKQICEIAKARFGRTFCFVLNVTNENLEELQEALDFDSDNTLQLRVGNAIIDHEDGRMIIYSNDSMGWGGAGTDILAMIR